MKNLLNKLKAFGSKIWKFLKKTNFWLAWALFAIGIQLAIIVPHTRYWYTPVITVLVTSLIYWLIYCLINTRNVLPWKSNDRKFRATEADVSKLVAIDLRQKYKDGYKFGGFHMGSMDFSWGPSFVASIELVKGEDKDKIERTKRFTAKSLGELIGQIREYLREVQA